MSELGIVAFALIALLVQGMWFLRQLTQERQEAWKRERDLLARIQARDPAEYRGWTYSGTGVPPEPEAEPRLFSEDGLLSVPYEDRGED